MICSLLKHEMITEKKNHFFNPLALQCKELGQIAIGLNLKTIKLYIAKWKENHAANKIFEIVSLVWCTG